MTLKRKRHFYEIFITAWSQRGKFRQNNDISASTGDDEMLTAKQAIAQPWAYFIVSILSNRQWDSAVSFMVICS